MKKLFNMNMTYEELKSLTDAAEKYSEVVGVKVSKTAYLKKALKNEIKRDFPEKSEKVLDYTVTIDDSNIK